MIGTLSESGCTKVDRGDIVEIVSFDIFFTQETKGEMLSVDIFFTQKIRMKRGANSASPNGNRGDDDGGYFDEGGEECDRVNYGYDN